MSKTPKRKSEKDNESVTSHTSVVKRPRANHDGELIAIYEGERELRSVTKTYTISKYSSRRSVNSDTSDFLNADSDDIADRLQQHTKTVSTPSVKTRNASSSSSAAPIAAPVVRRGRSRKDNSIINIEPSKRPDGYWSTQPTTTSSSSSDDPVDYPLNAANLSAQQALQKDWSEEASGRIIRQSTASSAARANSVSSTPTTRRTSQRLISNAENSSSSSKAGGSSTPIVSAGQQWVPPIAEALNEEEEEEEEETAVDPTATTEATTAAATITGEARESRAESSNHSSFAVLMLLLLVLANFAFNRKSVSVSSDGKAAAPPLVRLRADKSTLLDEHVKMIQNELARLQMSNGSDGEDARWSALAASLHSVETGLSDTEEGIRNISNEVSRDQAAMAEEAAKRARIASEVKAASDSVSAARAAADARRAAHLPHQYSLCDSLSGEGQACSTFTNSDVDQLVQQVREKMRDREREIGETRQEIDREWAEVREDLREATRAAAATAAESEEQEGEEASVDLLTVQISDAVEQLTRSQAQLDHQQTHLGEVGPALAASIQEKAEAAAAAAKNLETSEANRQSSLAKRNHLLDHLVRQNVAATLAAANKATAADVEEQEEEDEEEPAVPETPPKRSSEGVVDYAVGPRGGIILSQERLTSRHLCRSCSTSSATFSSSTAEEEASPLKRAAQSLGRAVSSALQAPEHRLASSAARRSLLSHLPPQLTDPAYTFSGTKGHVTVQLFAPVNVTQLSVVHVVGNAAEFLAAAPREVCFVGYTSDPLTAQHSFDLGVLKVIAPTKAATAGSSYTRSLDVDPSRGVPPLVAVRAEVLNNYGNREFTLLYRVKVMGELAEDL